MESIFLDANIIFDLFEGRRRIDLIALSRYQLHYSPLSIHIYIYTYKKRVPMPEIYTFLGRLEAKPVSLNGEIMKLALMSPTIDFEDNVQIHSAVKAECDYFYTNDKDLVKEVKNVEKMKFILEIP